MSGQSPGKRHLAPWMLIALVTAVFFAAAGQGWLYLVYGNGLPAGLDVAQWEPIAWRVIAAGWLTLVAALVVLDRSRIPWRVPMASLLAVLLGAALHLALRAALWRHLEGGCYMHGYSEHPYVPPGVDRSKVIFMYDDVCYDLLPDVASSPRYMLPFLMWTTAIAALVGPVGAWLRVRASSARVGT